MRFTGLGIISLVITFLCFSAAVSSGNNLLYLIYSFLFTTLIITALFNRINLSRLKVTFFSPTEVFQNTPYTLTLQINNLKFIPTCQLKITNGHSLDYYLSFLKPLNHTEVQFKHLLPHRGNNEINDYWFESTFPLSLFRSRKRIPPSTILAYPFVFDVYGYHSFPDVSIEKFSTRQRGIGEEFYGIRDYISGEDARLINWKLTAKTGRPLVKEYAQQTGNRVIFTVKGYPAEERTERQIQETASMVKFFIDSGAEVKLITDETEIDYGRGLLHLDKILTHLAMLGRGKVHKLITALTKLPPSVLSFGPQTKTDKLFYYLPLTLVLSSLMLVEDFSRGGMILVYFLFTGGIIFAWRDKFFVPRIVGEILALLIIPFVLFIEINLFGLILAMTHLTLAIIFLLLFRRKNEREWRELVLAGFLLFFLISGQTINLWYLTFYFLYFFTIGIYLCKLNGKKEPILIPPWLPTYLFLIGVSLSLTLLLFIITPRVENPRLTQILLTSGLTKLQPFRQSTIGYTDDVTLGYFGTLKQSAARVMRVSFPHLKQTNLDLSRIEPLRIRASWYNHFNGKKWTRSRVDFTYNYLNKKYQTESGRIWLLRNTSHRYYTPSLKLNLPSRVVEFYLHPLNLNIIFTPVLGDQVVILDSQFAPIYLDLGESLFFSQNYAMGTFYRLYIQDSPLRTDKWIPDYVRLKEQFFLSIPQPNSKIQVWVNRLIRQQTNQIEQARFVEQYLRKEYRYSITARFGRQTIEDFLFRTRTGNCEYFATAMTILLRYLNIPSRLVTGFLTNDWNEFGKFYDVRQNTAHAWVEAYFSDRGWVTFDPTPAEVYTSVLDTGFAKQVNKLITAVQLNWYRYVIGYDSYTQRNSFYQFYLKVPWRRILVVVFVIILVTVLWFSGTVHLIFLRIINKFTLKSKLPQWDLYTHLLYLMSRQGYIRAPWQTGKEFSLKVLILHPNLVELLEITDWYYQFRYGNKKFTETDLMQIKAKVNTVKLKLKLR